MKPMDKLYNQEWIPPQVEDAWKTIPRFNRFVDDTLKETVKYAIPALPISELARTYPK